MRYNIIVTLKDGRIYTYDNIENISTDKNLDGYDIVRFEREWESFPTESFRIAKIEIIPLGY